MTRDEGPTYDTATQGSVPKTMGNVLPPYTSTKCYHWQSPFSVTTPIEILTCQTPNMITPAFFEDGESGATQHTRAPSFAQASPPVGSTKGKLPIKISEARRLKHSYDPYAACVNMLLHNPPEPLPPHNHRRLKAH